MKSNKELYGILAGIAACIIYGLYPAATRGAYADGVNAAFIIIFTTFFRMFGLFGATLLTKKSSLLFSGEVPLKTSLLNGLFQAGTIIGILSAMVFLPGPVVIMIVLSYTIFLYLFLLFKGEEKFNPLILVVIITALLGLFLVLDVYNKFTEISWIGLFAAVTAMIMLLCRVHTYGKALKNSNPLIVATEGFIFTFILCLIVLFFQTPILPSTDKGWMYTGLATFSLVGGTFLTFYSLSILDSLKFAIVNKLEPIFGAIFAVLLINEVLNVTQYLGILIVTICLLLFVWLKRKQA